MERAANRTKVTDALRAALKKDKTRSNVRKISELGLVQMTRKRTRESLQQQLCAPCEHCEGTGRIQSVPTTAYRLLRQLRSQVSRQPHAQAVAVRAHQQVIDFLYAEAEWLDDLEARLHTRFFFQTDYDLHRDQFEITVTETRPKPRPAKRTRPSRRRTSRRRRTSKPETDVPAAEPVTAGAPG